MYQFAQKDNAASTRKPINKSHSRGRVVASPKTIGPKKTTAETIANTRAAESFQCANAIEMRGSQTHRMTSSARNRIESGIVMPSAFAVFRLTTSVNVVGCSIGKSAGFAPLNILST